MEKSVDEMAEIHDKPSKTLLYGRMDVEFAEDEKSPVEGVGHTLLVRLDGFEGPIDLLLHLARENRIDLKTMSILDLARQYIAFIEGAQNLKLEVAAEYLVMAAWLAYLKSRLLLPAAEAALAPSEEQEDAEAMAEALARQLRHLELLQNLAQSLQSLPRLGQDVFARGMPEGLKRSKKTLFEGNLYDLLRAYGDMAQRRQPVKTYEPIKHHLMAVEEAKERLIGWIARVLGKPRGELWLPLDAFLPRARAGDGLHTRGQRVAFFTAGLELAKQGAIELKQDRAFDPIFVRAKEGTNA